MTVKHKKKATVAKHQSAPAQPKPKRPVMFPKKPETKPDPKSAAPWTAVRSAFNEPEPTKASPPPKAVEQAPPATAGFGEEPKDLNSKIHTALLNLQVEVAGGIPYLTHKMLTASAVDTIIARLKECKLTIK